MTAAPVPLSPPWWAADPLVSADQVTDALGPVDNPDGVAAQVSGMVRSWCGWTISQQLGRTDVVDDNRRGRIYLPTLALIWVHGVYRRPAMTPAPGHPLPGDLGEPVTGFDWSDNGVVEVPATYWGTSSCRRAWAIIYDHGYQPVPDEVVAVTLTLATRLNDNPTGDTGIRLGSFSAQLKPAGGVGSTEDLLNAQERAVLGRYQLPRLSR